MGEICGEKKIVHLRENSGKIDTKSDESTSTYSVFQPWHPDTDGEIQNTNNPNSAQIQNQLKDFNKSSMRLIMEWYGSKKKITMDKFADDTKMES